MCDTQLRLPPEIPHEIHGPCAWYGPDLNQSSDWLEYLSSTEVEEVQRAVDRLVSESRDIVSIRREDFPLPTLGPRLQLLLNEALNGRGFVLLRALPVAGWTRRESAIAFFGIGAHLGNARSQNTQGPDQRGEAFEGQKPYFRIPVFSWHKGFLSAIYQRQYIESARRFADVPPLTPIQIEALDLFDALANDPSLNLFMELQPGDIQIVHNHTILHDRTAFEDWPDAGRKRHLLRLWLAPKDARPVPFTVAEPFR